MSNIVVQIADVTKEFTIHTSKSLKERFVDVFVRRKPQKFVAVNNANLSIERGETIGLVGHNGSGKSTLLKLIGGIISPTRGTIAIGGRIAALLELGAGFHPDLTGRENIYLNAAVLGLTRKQTDDVMDDIVEFSGLEKQFIDTQVKFYSSGMYVRLAFAVAVHTDPEILLVDEVLAVGDEPFQAKCMTKISEFQAQGKTILFVSHSADQVARVCSRAIVLNHGRIIFDGDVEHALRTLRESFIENEVSRKLELDSHHAGAGTPSSSEDDVSVKIKSIDVLKPSNSNELALASGDAIELETTIEARNNSVWEISFVFTNETGVELYSLSTAKLELEMPNRPGIHKVRLIIPDANFGARQLQIRAVLLDANGIESDQLDLTKPIYVEADKVGSGLLQFHPRVSVL